MTNHHVETVLLALQELLEVVANSIGVAELVAICILESDTRQAWVVREAVTSLISSLTIVTLIILIVVIVAKFYLSLQILDDFPTESTSKVQLLALFYTVVVILRNNWVVEVTKFIIIATCALVEVRERHRIIIKSILQTTVGIHRTCSIVSTTTTDICIAIANLEVEGSVLGRLSVQFQAEVVALEVRTNLDSLVVHVGIAECILNGLRTAIDVQVMIEGVTCATINDVLPIVCSYIFIHVHVLVVTKVICVRSNVLLILKQSKLILPLSIIIRSEQIHSLCNLLYAIVSVVANVYLTTLTALSGNEDYTISTTATIDCCRRSILQDCDVFDVGSRDVTNTIYRETIYNIKRIVALGDRTTTAHANLYFCIR